MKLHAACLFVLSLALCAFPARASAQSLVYVVRHAERADGGAGASAGAMSGAPADPHLSAAGVARAARLADMLADAGIKAIYVTEFKRTQETAAPLATKLHLAVDTTRSADSAALVASMKAQHPHDVVLVVGHSNTIPDIIKALGGPAITIGDNEYDSIFVVVPGAGVLSRIRF